MHNLRLTLAAGRLPRGYACVVSDGTMDGSKVLLLLHAPGSPAAPPPPRPPGAESQPSLLAYWNSYAATRFDASSSASPLPLDIEAAVRTANNTVSGIFSSVTKGVWGLPGSFQSATSSFPSGKALMYFGLFLSTGKQNLLRYISEKLEILLAKAE